MRLTPWGVFEIARRGRQTQLEAMGVAGPKTKKPSTVAGLFFEDKPHDKQGNFLLAIQLHQMAETVIAIGLNIVSVKAFIIVISPCTDKIAALNIAGDVVKLVVQTVKTINNAIWVSVIAGFEPSFPLNFLQIV